MKELAPLDSNF